MSVSQETGTRSVCVAPGRKWHRFPDPRQSMLLEGIDWRAPRRTAEGSDLMATRGGDERKEDFKQLEGLAEPQLSPAGDPAKIVA